MSRAAQIAAGVRSGRLDPLEVVEQCLARIAAQDGALHCFLHVDAEGARRRALGLREQVRAGRDPGRLAGVPVAIKDNIAVEGQPLGCASRILEGYRAPYHSHVVARLLAEGAVPVGRTNMDEFAMGASTENSAWGPTRNPWDVARVPGGSSGGSAAAVAAGLVPLALGSETGGSIRQPAALCGVTGFKPTYGAVSRFGLVAFASSLDVIGPLAADAADAALAHDVLAGHDPRDPTTWPGERPSAATAPRDLRGLRVGVPAEFLDDSVDAQVRARTEEALELLAARGARLLRLEPGRLAHMGLSIPVYYIVSSSEASSNLARFDGVRYGPRARAADLAETYLRTRAELFGPEVRRRILLGTFALSAGHLDAWYNKALAVRRLILDEFLALFAEVDLLAGPTSPFPAFPLGARAADPWAMYLCDILTAPVCLAGLPSVSVPCGLAQGAGDPLPVGLQLVGPPAQDQRVLAVAAAFEAARGEPERSPAFRAGLPAETGA